MREGWDLVKLGSLCDIQNGFAFDSKLFNNDGKGLPLIRIRDIKRGYSETFTTEECDNAYVVKDGDYLIGMDGEFNIGQWKSENALLNQRVCKLLPSSKILPRFIYYYIPKALKDIEDKTAYATVKHLSSKQIKEIHIPNISLPEQQRIVDILDREFAKIDALKSNAEKSLQAAKDLFIRVLDTTFDRIEYAEPLGNLVSIINGYAFKSEDFNKLNPVKSIKITNVGIGEFVETDDSNLPQCYFDEKKEFAVHSGDIVFALTRTIIAGGLKVAIIPESYNNALLNQRVAAISAYNIIQRHYLFYFFQTTFAKNYILKKVNTLMQPNLSIKDLRAMPIKVAKPNQQTMTGIVSFLDNCRDDCKKIQVNYQKTLTLCDALKQSLLRKAFNGEL